MTGQFLSLLKIKRKSDSCFLASAIRVTYIVTLANSLREYQLIPIVYCDHSSSVTFTQTEHERARMRRTKCLRARAP